MEEWEEAKQTQTSAALSVANKGVTLILIWHPAFLGRK